MNVGTLFGNVYAEFAALATTAAVSDPDNLFRRAANNAYVMMGLDPTDPTVVLSTQQALDAPWLAEYFALRSIVRQLAGATDSKTGVNERKKSQAFVNAEKLLAEAQAAIESRGYAVVQTFGLGRLDLDFLEPYYAPGVSNWAGF